jgi:hypothetical protein
MISSWNAISFANEFQWATYCVLLSVGLTLVVVFSLRVRSVKGIPIIGQENVGWKTWKTGSYFNENAQAVLEEGLGKVRGTRTFQQRR